MFLLRQTVHDLRTGTDQALPDVRGRDPRHRKKCRYCGEYLDESNQPVQKKSRAVFILLGLFFGGLGIHNFYIGRTVRGLCEALVGVIGFINLGICFSNRVTHNSLQQPVPPANNISDVLLGALALWILWEIFTTTQDAAGNPLK